MLMKTQIYVVIIWMLENDSNFSIGKVTGPSLNAAAAEKHALESENEKAFTLKIYHIV